MVRYDTIKLGDVCEILNGDRGHNYPSSTDFVEYGIPFINAGNISEKRVRFDNVDYITKEHYDKLRGAKLKKGDIVICLRGSLGKYALLEFEEGAPASSLAVLRAYAKRLNNHFLFHILDSNIIEHQINIENNGSSQPNLSAESVKRFMIPLPEMPEQKAIVDVLSDVDSLIISLQKLIDKKKAIKQGAMQELLTGKRRLHGYNEEWKKCAIKDVLSIGHGQSQHSIETELGCYPILATSGCIGYTNNFLWDKPSVLIGRKGTINKPQYIETPFWTIDTLFYTKIKNEYDVKFIYYQFCLIDWLQYNEASGVPSLSANVIEKIEIIIPNNKKEQQTIAQILSDIDLEIQQLGKKLVKYQQIKQGMMQELLTGHIRLVGVKDQEENKVQTIKEKSSQNHNQQFDDAVMIAGIVDAFYSDEYPLGRKKIQKLLYLVRRKQKADISAFHKKAAGPYADTIRYRGGEPIAKKNGYIQEAKGKNGSSFSKGNRIQQALDYLREWNKQHDIDWLVSEFKYTKVDELELLATVDMAACDLYQEGKDVKIQTIKSLIQSTKEWRDKLKKVYFSDTDIQRALKKCREMFHDTF